MCFLSGVSRASYYRHWAVVAPDEAHLAVRQAIQEVVLAHRRRYGYRRVAKDLHDRGLPINHKRVLAVMREDNLLAIRYRKYVLTTDSQHDCQVYLNLAARMTLTGVNQLWVADITYIRLRTEFVYLAVESHEAHEVHDLHSVEGDLTVEGELPAYRHLLPFRIKYQRNPIVDQSVPGDVALTLRILSDIRAALAAARGIYVHCRAGIGRTGLIVGCHLAQESERDGKAALKRLNELWRQSDRSKSWPKVPQTPEQAEYIKNWPKRENP